MKVFFKFTNVSANETMVYLINYINLNKTLYSSFICCHSDDGISERCYLLSYLPDGKFHIGFMIDVNYKDLIYLKEKYESLL